MDASEFIVENNIKMETELFAIADKLKKAGKKILQILFYLAQQKHWVTYLKIPGRWSLQVKTFFAQNKPARMWFISIPMGDVPTRVVENG